MKVIGKSEYFLGVVENDPNIDYEYYESDEFREKFDEGCDPDDAYRGWELGGADFIESGRNMDAILAAKRAGITTGPLTVPYPPCPAAETYPNRPPRPAWLPYTIPEPEEELCVAENRAEYGEQT